MQSFVIDTTSFVIGLSWLAFVVVFLITLFKSYNFYEEIEKKEEFKNVSSVAPLKNLYLTSFILQLIAIGLTSMIVVFVGRKV